MSGKMRWGGTPKGPRESAAPRGPSARPGKGYWSDREPDQGRRLSPEEIAAWQAAQSEKKP